MSSTYNDLKKERSKAAHAILNIDCIPAGMELFPASSDTSWDIIKRVIDESDIYILIIGGRYGSIPKNGERKSYTEMEYEYALKKRKPILAFIHADQENLQSYQTEKNQGLLDDFTERVKSRGNNVNFWQNEDELSAKIQIAIAAETKKRKYQNGGWIRKRDSRELFLPILEYCEQAGVRTIKGTLLSHDKIKRRLTKKQIDEIWLIGTTNQGFVHTYMNSLAAALAQGTDVYCMVADKNSEFIEDVSAVMSYPSRYGENRNEWKKQTARKKKNLNDEFESMKGYLEEIYQNALLKAKKNKTEPGHLYFGCAFTLVRQTMIMTISEKDNALWAWVSMTMPPRKTVDGTMGFEIQAKADNGNDDDLTLAEGLKAYAHEMAEYAKFRDCLVKVTGDAQLPDHFVK